MPCARRSQANSSPKVIIATIEFMRHVVASQGSLHCYATNEKLSSVMCGTPAQDKLKLRSPEKLIVDKGITN